MTQYSVSVPSSVSVPRRTVSTAFTATAAAAATVSKPPPGRAQAPALTTGRRADMRRRVLLGWEDFHWR